MGWRGANSKSGKLRNGKADREVVDEGGKQISIKLEFIKKTPNSTFFSFLY